jgi:hypothetical protein
VCFATLFYRVYDAVSTPLGFRISKKFGLTSYYLAVPKSPFIPPIAATKLPTLSPAGD